MKTANHSPDLICDIPNTCQMHYCIRFCGQECPHYEMFNDWKSMQYSIPMIETYRCVAGR